MSFCYDIPVLAIVAFGVSLAALLYISIVYGLKLRTVRRSRVLCDADDVDMSQTLPKASVVVYARNEDACLAETLPLILTQRYPGYFEVIVVNDGTPDETDLTVTRLKAQHHNLYLTFAPDNSRNLSRKKLAITLGVKAAKGDVIVVTDATNTVASDQWLAHMVRPFVNPSTEVVIGYNSLYMPEGRWGGRLLTAFDNVADTVAWLSSAIKGKPYRACGSNVAYRRDLFMRNKGFASSLNLRNGDDDLFINEIANDANTEVCLASDSIGEAGDRTHVRKSFKRQRRDHAFTGRMLPKGSRRLMAVGDWLIWLTVACAIVGAVLSGITNLFGWAVAALLCIILYVVLCVMWRSTIKALNGPAMCLSLPWLAAMRPLRNAWTNLHCGSRNNACYSWQ